MPKMVLQLIDADQGHPLQTWTFEDRDEIRLGRLPDNDLVLTDPRVSRSHAVLKRSEEGWRLYSLSSQMIQYEGEMRQELELQAGNHFRLGRSGALLRFLPEEDPTLCNTQTISLDSLNIPELSLDVNQLQQEVNRFVKADFFDDLKESARRFREQRTTIGRSR